MVQRRVFGQLLILLLLVVGMSVPTAAVSTESSQSSVATDSETESIAVQSENGTQNDSGVNITVGQQLSTVIDVSSDEVQTDFQNTEFEVSVEGAGEERRAEVVAERAAELRERAQEIREDYREATEAYEAGEMSKSEYAQRLATLNSRATNLHKSYEQFRQRAETVSALELRAAGVNQSALRASVESLSAVSGAGTTALLERFTGQSDGKIEIETAEGLSIEIESEDGEQSREIERPRDDDSAINVTQSAALETARTALSTPKAGSWVLTGTKIRQDEGAYRFEFALRGAPIQTGEAEVSVDGSSGTVFKLEEEIRARTDESEGDEGSEKEDDDKKRELALLVAEGTPAPNATITLAVRSDGAPVENANVSVNGRSVGTTGPNGTVSVTLPASGEVDVTARSGEAEGELEFEFDEDEDREGEVFRKLNVKSTLDGDTVTVAVTYDGSGVTNANVFANGRSVGTTGPNGTVTFTIDASTTEELEIGIVKGEFETELEYVLRDGALTPTEEREGEDADEAESEGQESEDADEAESEEQEGEDDDADDVADSEESNEDSADDDADGEDERQISVRGLD